MSIRTDLERRIEKEKQKVTELRSQIDKSEAFIQGLQEALKLTPKEAGKDTRRTVKHKAAKSFRAGSDVAKTYSLLQQTGKAMHISEILIGIKKEDTKANRLSLSSSLSRYVRNNQIFSRPKPNSFGLKEHADIGAITTPQLPPEFGSE